MLRGGRFDVLNTHSRRDTVLASIGARLAGTPLIVRTRHLAKPIHSLYAYTWLAHRVIAVSRYVRGQLLEGGARPEAVEVIHSPVSLPPDRPGACLRRELSIPPEAKVVGCVAVMRAEKGHEDLIEAFSRVSRRHADAHLVLVGDGMPLAEQLRERVRAGARWRGASISRDGARMWARRCGPSTCSRCRRGARPSARCSWRPPRWGCR